VRGQGQGGAAGGLRARRRRGSCRHGSPAATGACPFGSDSNVAQESHLEAAADGVAVDSGDGRDGQTRAASPTRRGESGPIARDDRRRRHSEFGEIAAG